MIGLYSAGWLLNGELWKSSVSSIVAAFYKARRKKWKMNITDGACLSDAWWWPVSHWAFVIHLPVCGNFSCCTLSIHFVTVARGVMLLFGVIGGFGVSQHHLPESDTAVLKIWQNGMSGCAFVISVLPLPIYYFIFNSWFNSIMQLLDESDWMRIATFDQGWNLQGIKGWKTLEVILWCKATYPRTGRWRQHSEISNCGKLYAPTSAVKDEKAVPETGRV